jgi:dTDP-4-amino-4,6-dideoxygalactose transaminase
LTSAAAASGIEVPFSRPFLSGQEHAYVAEAIASRHWRGDGPFTRRCQELLRQRTGYPCYLTASGTHGLEIAALALRAEPGDEVIIPDYTFASTATCLVQAGLRPVFVDVREDTFNLDERLLEQALTARTRAIMPVHYAGVAADMEAIEAVARRYGLAVIEDAAHGVEAHYRGRPLGTLGSLGVYSFHETKNLSCGEGGAVIVAEESWQERVEVHRDVGTDRARFLRGEIPQYSWIDRGSNYLLSDILAAFLLAQLEQAPTVTARRGRLFARYLGRLSPLHEAGRLRLPVIPPDRHSNFHFFHILLEDAGSRDRLRRHLVTRGVGSAVHYTPLHQTRGGQRFGIARGPLTVSRAAGERLLRLPLYADLEEADQDRVIDAVLEFFAQH